MFRPDFRHETNPLWDETIFRFGEDVPKPALVTKSGNETTGPKAHDRGQS